MITHAASRKQYTVLLDRPERRALFREGFRSEPRIFVCAAHKNTLSPRKVFSRRTRRRKKTDFN